MKKRSVRGAMETIKASADICLGTGSYIEIYGKNNISVRGCYGVSEYSAEKITLRLNRGTLSVCGKSLLCESYTNGEVHISGRIDMVCFGGGEEKNGQ